MRCKTLPAILCSVVCCFGQHKQIEHPVKYSSRGLHGSIACGSEFAAEAGMRLYFSGGNAVDAAIAGMEGAMVETFQQLDEFLAARARPQ